MLLPSNILDLLQAQYAHEMCNHFRYVSRASWAEFRGLDGTAAFFSREAGGEAGHAAKVRKFIEDRNFALVPVVSFDEPIPAGAAYGDLFSSALMVERDTTERLNAIYKAGLDSGDYQTMAFVMPMIEEQTEEENTYQTILDRIAQRGVSDAGVVHDIDVWLAERAN